MAETDVIRSYLLALGFKVDEAGLRRFEGQLESGSKMVAKFAGAVEAAAVAVEAAVLRMAAGLDQLYFASQRTGAAVENIQALGYAAAQTGSSVSGARSSLEGLAAFLRNNPGGEGFIRGLGVTSRDAAVQVQQLGAAFRRMPTYLAHTYASMLGIDDRTALAMRSGDFDRTAQEHRERLRAAGLDEDKAAASANALMHEFRALEDTFGVLANLIYSKLTGQTGSAIRQFRQTIETHYKQISDFITGIANVVLKAADVVTNLVMAVSSAIGEIVDAFSGLSNHSKGLIEAFAALGAAWLLLNSRFAMSPLGLIMELGAALVLLWDDYQGWKNGATSLIDWGKWEPDIQKAKAAISWIGEHIDSLAQSVGGWQNVLEGVAVLIAGSWALRIIGAFGRVGAAFLATSASMAESGLGKLLGMAGGAGIAGLAIGADQLEKALAPEAQEREANWENRNIPGAAFLEDWTARHMGWGRTYEQQRASQAGQGGSIPANPNNDTRDQQQKSEEIFSFWKSKGYSDAAAVAMVAAAHRESAFNAGARGDHGHAGGLYQWQQPRRDRILAATGIDVWTADLHGQMEAAYQEQRQHLDAGAGRVYDFTRNASSMVVGIGSEVNDFERPLDREGAIAGDLPYAQEWLRLHQFRSSPLFQPQGYQEPGTPAPGGGTTINQETHVHVNGQSDPQAAAREVARQQDSVNQRIVRQTRSMAY